MIETEEDILREAAALAAIEPRFGRALELAGRPKLRRWAPGFPGLLRIIVGQLVSTAAAAAIWGRIMEAGLDDRAAFLAAGDERLRACGLSRAKIRAGRAAAGADLDGLSGLDDAAAAARLIELPGVGRWSADLYLLACLGRPDVFAAGDLALREAARTLFELDSRPSRAELGAMATAWSPHRATAARLLWEWIAFARGREGLGT